MENGAQTVGKGDLRRPRYPNIDIPGNHRGFSNGSSYLMKSRVQTCEPPLVIKRFPLKHETRKLITANTGWTLVHRSRLQK